MREGNVINGVFYSKGANLSLLIKNFRGGSYYYLKKLACRAETRSFKNFDFSKPYTSYTLMSVISKTFPKKSSFGHKYLFNVYLLDILSLYRGWRHSRCLPVNGQRTWSNGWTASRRNNLLKYIQVKKGRSIYGNFPLGEIYTARLAEQVNLIWHEQWYDEWYDAFIARVKSKKHKNVVKTDLYSMAQGNVMSPTKFAKLSKKQQQAYNKNHFTLGFKPGFTRLLLKQLYDLRVSGQKFGKAAGVILHKSELGLKKKQLKRKKVDLKAKKAAHVAKKKRKKSAWE